MSDETRHNPYQVGQSDPKTPYEAESDVGETTAWCDRCGDERRFVRDTREGRAQVEEQRADMPDVRRAITGDTGWRCTVCGTLVPRLIDEEAYGWQYSNIGYDKPQFDDEERTIREASADGVTPPNRADTSYAPGEPHRPEEQE